MKRSFLTFLTGLAVASCLASTPARAEVVVEVFPPAAYIATAAPVYFEGHAAYWWGNRWYYREGPSWRYYHAEPPFLRDWRGHHEVARRYYERRWRR
jgi:hypothetical protein